MSGLVSSGGGLSPTTGVSKQTRQQLVAVRDDLLVSQANEEKRFLLEDQKIGNGYRLADRAIMRHTALHRQIAMVSAGDPALEMDLKMIQQGLALGVALKIQGYVR